MIVLPWAALFQVLIVPVFATASFVVLAHDGSLVPPVRHRTGVRREALDLPLSGEPRVRDSRS